jgi:hypothetical protein
LQVDDIKRHPLLRTHYARFSRPRFKRTSRRHDTRVWSQESRYSRHTIDVPTHLVLGCAKRIFGALTINTGSSTSCRVLNLVMIGKGTCNFRSRKRSSSSCCCALWVSRPFSFRP